MRKIIRIVFSILPIICIGQNKDYVQNIVPQTPEVSSLLKNFETPVSLNTGIPNISIPIYTIEEGDISLDLAISYNSSGISVGEKATWVGLGWNLPISTLVRNVRQVPDDIAHGFFYENQYTVNNVYNEKLSQEANNTGLGMVLPTNSDNQYHAGLLDLESDDYRVTLPDGKAINFMVNQERDGNNPVGQFVQFPNSDYKIQYNQTNGEWTFINPSGYKYLYIKGNQINFSHTYSIGGNSIGTLTDGNQTAYANSWIISKIISPIGKEINFEYDPVFYDDCEFVNQTKTVAYDPALSGMGDGRNTVFTNYGRTKGYNFFIKRIYGNFGEIMFNKSDRLDYLNYGRKLDNVEIKNAGRLINKISFSYTYKESVVSSPVYSCNRYENTSEIGKRLQLDKVTFYTETGIPYSYKLNYNPTLLPHRFSYARDWWGYYNGKYSNTGLTPSIDLVLEEYNNRDVNQEYSKANILEEIIYPTGGKTKFFFENNKGIDYNNSWGLGDEFHNIIPYQIKSKHFSTNENITNQLYKTYTVPVGVNINNLTNYQNLVLKIDTNTSKCLYGESSLPFSGSCSIYYSIINSNNETIVPKTLLYNTSRTLQIPYNKLTSENKLKVELYLGNNNGSGLGQYFDVNTDEATVDLSWKELDNTKGRYINQVGFEVPFGGLRVSKIENYDSNNDPSYIKNYTYKDDEGIESGISNFQIDFLQSIPGKDFVTSQSRFPMQNSKGNVIEYLKATVEEKNVIDGENKTISHYFKNNNILGNFLGSCYFGNFDGQAPMSSASVPCYQYPLNGYEILTKSISYNEEKMNYNFDFSTQSKNQKKVYGIDYDRVKKPQDFKYASYNDGYHPQAFLGIEYFYYKFKNFDELPNEFSTIRKDFVSNTTLTTETKYNYNNPVHYQLSSQQTTSPDGNITQTTYQYAHEKNNQKLINANMIGIPLETSVVKKQNASDAGKTISKTETRYDNPAHLFPTSVLSYDLQNTVSQELSYDQYDSKGNLQQYTTKDGVPTAIIWGYNQTQPIAKIVGATYVQVSSLAAAIVSASNLDASNPSNEAALITALDTFRKDSTMANYQISTYTYDPLIGVTTITPPSGIREVYIYDAANRLKEIRENSATGKLLKEFKYNYKN